MDLDSIYREYRDKVYGYLLHKLNNPTVAEDICSDVFLKVCSKLPDYNSEKASISTWIYHITQNTLYDHFRTDHTAQMSEIDENLVGGEDDFDNICREEMLESLAASLEKLTERERTVTVLHYYEGLTLMEVAERTGISYSYAKVIHKDAINKLKRLMKDFI